MVIKLPRQHIFPRSMRESIFNDAKVSKPDSDENFPEWEISVSRQQDEDDIAWSIVLSYLFEANDDKKTNDFERRLKALTGSEDKLIDVKKSIRSFNPFRNRYACFFDDTLKNVVEDFKTNLNWCKSASVFDKISEASKTLKCQILLILDYPKSEKYHLFSVKENSETPLDMITLISSSDVDDENREIKMYNFMIRKSLGLILREDALIYFLIEAGVESFRYNLSVEANDNYLLISILKKRYFDIILKLYDSSCIVSKISEAGFVMDPRMKDADGLSAFHHAVIAGNFKVLYKLYYFAADNYSSSENTYRNPYSCIVSNLSQMREILLSDLLKLEDVKQNEKYENWKNTLDELVKLTDFLRDVNSKILNLEDELNCHERTPGRIFEANKRIDIIISLLDTYKKFFNYSLQEKSDEKKLDDYNLHKNYYKLVDKNAAIIFFDNIFLLRKSLRQIKDKDSHFQSKEEPCLNNEKSSSSIDLKEKLQVIEEKQISTSESKITKKKELNEKLVSDMESSFFILVFYHIFFDIFNIENAPNYQNRSKQLFRNTAVTHDTFSLMKRLNNLDKITNFTESLQRNRINEESDLSFNCSEEINLILYSYPEVKDFIDCERMKNYVTTALNVKVATVESVLAIERALQVIGEYLMPAKENDNSYLKICLSLCVPGETRRILRQLRNDTSHLKSRAFPLKIESENNFSLFRSIQKEIEELENYFKIVYSVLEMRTVFYVVQHLNENFKEMGTSENLYRPYEKYFFLDEMPIQYVNDLPSIIFKSHKYAFLCFIEMTLEKIKDEIMKENFKSDRNYSEKITHFRNSFNKPLNYFLTMLEECVEFTQYEKIKHLVNINAMLLKENYSAIGDFTASIIAFLCECNKFLSNLQNNPKKIKLKPLNIMNIENFQKKIKGFTFLTDDEKNKIRKEIPQTVRNSVLIKEKFIQSINENFSLKIDLLQSSEYQISYFSKSKMKKFQKLYEIKDLQVLDLLNSPDPITELEDILSNNSVGKKKYEEMCEIMNFSDETRKKLGKLVAGQHKKVQGNNLQCLLNRVQLLKKVIIEDNEEISNLWVKFKSQKPRQLIFDKIVQNYVRDRQQQSVTEQLLFDCMMLFEVAKLSENPWIKPQKLYTGINLRNVISHGSPLLESLCKMIDPKDLPCEVIRKVIKLVEAEDTVQAILQLHDSAGHDYKTLLKVINSDEQDGYCDLRNRIKKCEEWRDYVKLLPYPEVAVQE